MIWGLFGADRSIEKAIVQCLEGIYSTKTKLLEVGML